MQKDNTEYSTNLQRRIFGERYAGASVSRIKTFPAGSLEHIAKWIENPNGFVVLLGPAGVGKTYFCAAMLDHLPKNVNFIRGYSEKNLLKSVRQSISDSVKGDYIGHLHSMIDDDLIILDDLGSSGHTDWREEIILEFIDYRYSSKKPTIFTSNLSKNDLYKIYGQRIASRLLAKENTVIDLFECSDLRQEGL